MKLVVTIKLAKEKLLSYRVSYIELHTNYLDEGKPTVSFIVPSMYRKEKELAYKNPFIWDQKWHFKPSGVILYPLFKTKVYNIIADTAIMRGLKWHSITEHANYPPYTCYIMQKVILFIIYSSKQCLLSYHIRQEVTFTIPKVTSYNSYCKTIFISI